MKIKNARICGTCLPEQVYRLVHMAKEKMASTRRKVIDIHVRITHFSWFGRNWRLAKDFENLAETLATFVTLASIQLALRRLARE
jgi:hypothetical protein